MRDDDLDLLHAGHHGGRVRRRRSMCPLTPDHPLTPGVTGCRGTAPIDRPQVASQVVEVRPCEPQDIPNLDRALPIGGPYGHAHRLRGQDEGRWLYLVAFEPGPVGGCLVQWGGPVDDVVRRQLPDAVEISNLFVAAGARGRGAGHALIEEAERQTVLRGRAIVGVAVGDENPDARRLYERLGYAETGSRYRAEYDYESEEGETVHAI